MHLKETIKQKLEQKKKLFIPVIHCLSRESIKHSVSVAHQSSVDGVVFIDQGNVHAETIIKEIIPEVRRLYPKLPVGLNILGNCMAALNAKPDFIWTDQSGIGLTDSDTFPLLPKNRDSLWFGGVAFKYQKQVPKEHWHLLASRAKEYMDVVVTSGDGTGVAIEPDKAKSFKEALTTNYPLGVASGVTTENVNQILNYVDVFIVASSIEKTFGFLDLEKTKLLSDLIHYYNHP